MGKLFYIEGERKVWYTRLFFRQNVIDNLFLITITDNPEFAYVYCSTGTEKIEFRTKHRHKRLRLTFKDAVVNPDHRRIHTGSYNDSKNWIKLDLEDGIISYPRHLKVERIDELYEYFRFTEFFV